MFLSQSTHSVRLCGRACPARAGLTRRHTRFWKEIAPSLWLANWKIQYGASTFLLVKISSFHLLFYPTETKHWVRAGVFAMRFSNALSCTQNYAPLILCISIMLYLSTFVHDVPLQEIYICARCMYICTKTNVKKVCARRRLDGSRCFRFCLRIYQ